MLARRRRLAVPVLIGAALLLGACKGAPDSAFNGGSPVVLTSWQFDTHQVLRLADGSTLVSRYDPAWDVSDPNDTPTKIVKLSPDGSVDLTWGDAGEARVRFQGSNMGSGFTAGAVQPSGKVLLYGQRDQYTTVIVRLGTDGALDSTYGVTGTLVTEDAWNGIGIGTCALATNGTARCAQVTSPTPGTFQVERTDIDVDGQVLGTTTDPIDLSTYVTLPGPTGTVSAALYTFPAAVDVVGDRTLLAVGAGTTYRDGDGFVIGTSETSTLLIALDASGIDTAYGTNGVAQVDLDGAPDGSVSTGSYGAWSTYASWLDAGTDGSATFLATVYDDTAGGSRSAVVRLDATGAYDTAFSTDGVVSTTDAVGTAVDAATLATRDGADVTVVGTRGTLPTSQAVVLRYLPDGTLDTAFAGDGVAELPGAELGTGLDLRNGRVTVGGASLGAGSPDADAVVGVLGG